MESKAPRFFFLGGSIDIEFNLLFNLNLKFGIAVFITRFCFGLSPLLVTVSNLGL